MTHSSRIPPFRARRSVFSAAAALPAVLAAALLMSPAFAQAVPLPRPAPKARDAGADAPRAPAPAPGPSVAAPPPQSGMPSLLPDLGSLFGGKATPAASLTPAQRAAAQRVSAYLSSLQNLSGHFVQVGPDGSRSTGDFYIQKPGKVRFEYDDPSPIAIVADGSTVVVRDRRLATQDIYPLSQTPLRFLLSDRIDLTRDTNLIGVSADDMFISVTIEESQPMVGTSRLMMMFGAKDAQLKQWTVTDPQGYDTTVAVSNLDTTRKLDPGLFKIDFTSYPTSRN